MADRCGNEKWSYLMASVLGLDEPGTVHVVEAYEAAGGSGQPTVYLVKAHELDEFSGQHGHRVGVVSTMRDGEVIG